MSVGVSHQSGSSDIGNSYFDDGKHEQAIRSYSEAIVRTTYNMYVEATSRRYYPIGVITGFK